jgi:hypothetical protein
MDFYEMCLSNLNDFIYGDKELNKKDLYDLLRNIFGHEPCELLKDPGNTVSISDIKTDLRYMFDAIKSQGVPK